MAGASARQDGRAGGPAGRRAFAQVLPPHLRQEAAFIAAARHSRRVRLLRRAIPLACAGTLVFLVLRSLAGLVTGGDAGVEGVSIQGRKIVMEKPKLSGFKRDGRSYELTAATATQDLRVPNIMDLDRLTARFQTGNDGWANLEGARGLYDSKTERLDVDGGLTVRTETGLNARLKDARIEFRGGTIVTDKSVEVTMPQGDIEAEAMQVLDNGRKLVFEGRVRSVFVNTRARDAPAAPEENSAPATAQE
jgi:lipopolysaccharide export system protein LptC